MWYKFKDPTEVRGQHYDKLLNINTGAHIWLGTYSDQDEDDIGLVVFAEYPGINTRAVFKGTIVECIRHNRKASG